MTFAWQASRRVEVPCTVRVTQTRDDLFVAVELDGIDVEPGDRVQVHDAPTALGFGERIVVRRRATVVRAGPVRRYWTRASGYLGLLGLFEVGFSERRAS